MNALNWPEDLGSGIIVARMGYMDADRDDDNDRPPELVPARKGTVTLTPSVATIRYKGSKGPLLLTGRQAIGVIDHEGYLCTKKLDYNGDPLLDDNGDLVAGARGLVMPATNSKFIEPTDFTYRVTVNVPDKQVATYSISLEDGETKDLAEATPVRASVGIHTIIDSETAIRSEAARDKSLEYYQGAEAFKDAAEDAVYSTGGIKDRLIALEALGGLSPGEVVDSQTANLVTQPESLTRKALEDAVARDVAQAIGAAFVYSVAKPYEKTRYGVPIVWIAPTTNYSPEVQINTLTAQYLSAMVEFYGFDHDGDRLTYTVNWGDGEVTTNAFNPSFHEYSEPGIYTVSVTADDGLAQTTVSRELYVAAPITGRWAADTFSYADGTILSGWQSDSRTPRPSKTTEIGGLMWEPGDATTGLTLWSNPAEVWAGRFGISSGIGRATRSASLTIPESSARISFDYETRKPGEDSRTLARVSAIFAASPATELRPVSVTSLMVRLSDSKELQIWAVSGGPPSYTYTSIARTSHRDIPERGRMLATYDAITGDVHVVINGVHWLDATYDGPAYPKVGIEARDRATIDNFEVGPL